ncbi:MAG: ABC transporter ATP-binding protein [Holophagaceae bacterium]|nr:ABC transporter ATP-binding protein [Holophagaceae bacterium]
MTVLKGIDLTKAFHDGNVETQVLRGVSLELQAGEVVSLEGPSGSGKTTLLQILGCILSPSAGTLHIHQHKVDSNSKQLAAVRRRNIGFVFQQFNLFPSLSALENVQYAINLKGVKGPAAKNEAAALLDSVGLSDRARYLPRDLSGGQKQRVAIARALACKPSLLLADEPTANLDSTVGSQILELFRDLAKQENRALLIVTHDPKVRSIADRVLQIHDGRLQS